MGKVCPDFGFCLLQLYGLIDGYYEGDRQFWGDGKFEGSQSTQSPQSTVLFAGDPGGEEGSGDG